MERQLVMVKEAGERKCQEMMAAFVEQLSAQTNKYLAEKQQF
jgi:hypothetical protein